MRDDDGGNVECHLIGRFEEYGLVWWYDRGGEVNMEVGFQSECYTGGRILEVSLHWR